MMFQNDYSISAVEEAGELAEEFKSLSAVELAVLAKSLPATMTDPEIYQHYLDNILKIHLLSYLNTLPTLPTLQTERGTIDCVCLWLKS